MLVITSLSTGVLGHVEMVSLPWIWLVIRHTRVNESITKRVIEALLVRLTSSSTRPPSSLLLLLSSLFIALLSPQFPY